MSAKLNKRGKIPSKYVAMAVLLGAIILISIQGCNSKSKVADSDHSTMQLTDKVLELSRQIAVDDYIGTEMVARQQHVDSAHLRKQELMRIATDDELVDLIADPNPIVSLTAFQGLYNRGNSLVPTVFNGYKIRTDHIRFVRGDLLMDMPMLEYAYVHIMHYEIPNDDFNSETPEHTPKFELSDKDQMEVVRIINGLRSRY